jgi:hypothetical protein
MYQKIKLQTLYISLENTFRCSVCFINEQRGERERTFHHPDERTSVIEFSFELVK